MVSWITLKSFFHFWVYFCEWCKLLVWFHFFSWSCPVFPAPFIGETAFAPLYVVPPLLNINCSYRRGFIPGLSVLFLCQDQAALITVTIWSSSISGVVIPPVLFFFCRIADAIWGLFSCSQGAKIKRVPLRSATKQGYPLSPLLQLSSGSPSHSNQTRRRNKRHPKLERRK